QPYMNLLKTDSEGNRIASASPPISSPSYGYAITKTANDEIVVVGNSGSDTQSSAVLMGYQTDLSANWSSPQVYGVANMAKEPYHSVFETNTGDLAWVSITKGTQTALIESSFVEPDNDRPVGGTTLFLGRSVDLSGNAGDFIKLPVGYAATQAIDVNSLTKIGVSFFDQSELTENTLSLQEDKNYFPTSICRSANGLLIASYSDYHENSSDNNRSDYDLFLIETDFDGQPKANGISGSFGGSGNEIPVRLRNAADGGFLVLGSVTNSKGAVQIFLLKVDSQGKLN
ncbi:MAG: hypothetical protein KDD63_29150, partial [Bacteroidetes bacterium]|nr:hypothetical protein [Bacteroidota bacterium]